MPQVYIHISIVHIFAVFFISFFLSLSKTAASDKQRWRRLLAAVIIERSYYTLLRRHLRETRVHGDSTSLTSVCLIALPLPTLTVLSTSVVSFESQVLCSLSFKYCSCYLLCAYFSRFFINFLLVLVIGLTGCF